MAPKPLDADKQVSLELEYADALIIRDQFEVVLNTISRNPQQTQVILGQCDRLIKAILFAQTREEFNLHQNRLQTLYQQLAVKANLVLHDELEILMQNFRFYRKLRDFLKQTSFESFQQQFDLFAEQHERLDELQHWRERLENLKQACTMDFDAEKTRLLQDLNKAHSLTSKDTKNRYALLAYTGWISFDFSLLIAATVLVFAPIVGPGVAVAVFTVGVVSLIYNVFDFAQTTAALYRSAPQSHQRQLTEQSKAKVRLMLNNKCSIDPDHICNLHMATNEAWLKEQLWMKRVNFAITLVSLLLTVGSFATLMFPVLSLPIAAVIAATVISYTISLIAAGILTSNLLKEREITKQTEAQIQTSITDDQKLMDALELNGQDPHIGHVYDARSTNEFLIQQGITADHALPPETADEAEKEVDDAKDTTPLLNNDRPLKKDPKIQSQEPGETHFAPNEH
jgi:hypothetical protein